MHVGVPNLKILLTRLYIHTNNYSFGMNNKKDVCVLFTDKNKQIILYTYKEISAVWATCREGYTYNMLSTIAPADENHI